MTRPTVTVVGPSRLNDAKLDMRPSPKEGLFYLFHDDVPVAWCSSAQTLSAWGFDNGAQSIHWGFDLGLAE
jgi:hypothetical protein